MAKQIFGSYRKDDFADPKNFLLQLGMVLERYADGIIREVTSPVTGIQRKCKFPPSIAEVVEFCDNEVVRLAKLKRYSGYGQAQKFADRPRRDCIANVLVTTMAPQYHAMVERSRNATPREFRHDERGIWVPLGWLSEPSAKPAGFRQFTCEDLEAIYRKADGAAACEDLEAIYRTELEPTPFD